MGGDPSSLLNTEAISEVLEPIHERYVWTSWNLVNSVQGHYYGNGRGVSLIQGVAEKAGTVREEKRRFKRARSREKSSV